MVRAEPRFGLWSLDRKSGLPSYASRPNRPVTPNRICPASGPVSRTAPCTSKPTSSLMASTLATTQPSDHADLYLPFCVVVGLNLISFIGYPIHNPDTPAQKCLLFNFKLPASAGPSSYTLRSFLLIKDALAPGSIIAQCRSCPEWIVCSFHQSQSMTLLPE